MVVWLFLVMALGFLPDLFPPDLLVSFFGGVPLPTSEFWEELLELPELSGTNSSLGVFGVGCPAIVVAKVDSESSSSSSSSSSSKALCFHWIEFTC